MRPFTDLLIGYKLGTLLRVRLKEMPLMLESGYPPKGRCIHTKVALPLGKIISNIGTILRVEASLDLKFKFTKMMKPLPRGI